MIYSKYKILKHLDRIKDFYDGRKPSPNIVTIEPSNKCNLGCYWCYPEIQGWRNPTNNIVMNKDILLMLPHKIKQWGVNYIQLTGGGEPLLHPNIEDFIYEVYQNKLNYAIVTNGICLNKVTPTDNLDWIGISIDAGSKEVYSICKNVNGEIFDVVINNIKNFIKLNIKTHVTYKYLITPKNIYDIENAIILAKDIKVNAIYFRYPTETNESFKTEEIEFINKIINKYKDDKEIDVLFNVEKVNSNFKQDLTGMKCIATPALLNITADCGTYWCQDKRGDNYYSINTLSDEKSFEFLKQYWGSYDHIAKIKNVIPEYDCTKCCLSSYNRILENVKDMFIEYI